MQDERVCRMQECALGMDTWAGGCVDRWRADSKRTYHGSSHPLVDVGCDLVVISFIAFAKIRRICEYMNFVSVSFVHMKLG